MRTRSSISIALGVSCLILAVSESRALAAVPWPACDPAPTPPAECANEPQYGSGVTSGQALVWSSWGSKKVNKDCANWDFVKQAALTTIPTIVTNYLNANGQLDTKVQCRAKGLIDGASCELKVLPDCPHICAMDGIDWGTLSADLYCLLSVDLGGLGDVTPWFIRPNPATICATNFQDSCDETFEINAGESATCQPYTVDPWHTVFADNEYVSCSFDVPAQ